MPAHKKSGSLKAFKAKRTYWPSVPNIVETSNHSPVLDTIGAQVVNEGEVLTFTISATDSNGV